MIHPTAIISPEAKIGQNVSIGAFSIIDATVTIGDHCTIDPHVWITGKTVIGEHNFIGYGSQIGGLPQDTSFDPSTDSGTIIGNHNTIREHVTIHRSTAAGKNTSVGDKNFLMINTHLAHDVQIGNHNTIANNCMLAGHIHMGSFCFLGGGAGFHQFIKIGDYAIVQGNASISKDIPPYCMAHAYNQLAGLNVIGLRRAGFDATTRAEIKQAYKLLFDSGHTMTDALAASADQTWSDASQILFEAAKNPSRKGILMK